jgi:hypothetical protein
VADRVAAPIIATGDACTVFVEDPVPLRVDRVEVLAKYTESVGDSLSARFEDNAKIDVVTTKAKAGDPPLSVRLMLNTTLGVAGTWKLTIKGQGGECVGDVYVGPGKGGRGGR